MFSMLLCILLLLFLLDIVAAQERDKFCIAPKPPLPLPACTRQCLIGENKVLDGTCADDLSAFCQLSDVVSIHFKIFGPCLLNACPSVTDRQHYVNMFVAACEDTGEFEDTKFEDGGFNYQDLLMGTPSSSITTSTEESTSSSVTTLTITRTTVKISTTTASRSSTSPSTLTSSSSPETEKSSDAPSQPPTPAASNLPDSTNGGESTSSVAAPPPDTTSHAQLTSQGQDDATTHTHVTVAMTSEVAYPPAENEAAEKTISTPVIAGIAAGGTMGIALIIGLVLFLLHRRKRRASFASSADIWEPSRNTSPKPKLPTIDHDSSFGRYSEVGARAPMRQRSKAELHSEDILRPQTAHDGYSDPPEMRGASGGGGGGESARYHYSSKRPEAHRHGSNMDSRYPEMGSHAATSVRSPTSPVSPASTMQGWYADSPSGVPTIRMSSADLRSEEMRSPVSELATNVPLRSTHSAQLHGAEITSPISGLGTDNYSSGSNGAAELHTDPVLPPKFGLGVRGDMTAVIAEMEGSDMQKGHRHGVSTNF